MKPFYIGVGNDNTFKRAKEKHGRNSLWSRIVEKHGYRVDILMSDIDRNEALVKEIEFIQLYGRLNLNKGTLVNMTDGGEVGKLNHFVSIETREKQRILSTGRIPWNKGKSGYKKRGVPVTDEIKERQRAESKTNGEVVQYSLDGEILGTFLSCTHASKVTGINCGNIYAVLNEDSLKTHGFIFKYKNKPFIRAERLINADNGEMYFTLEQARVKTNSPLSRAAFNSQVDRGVSIVKWVGKRKAKPNKKGLNVR